MIPEDRLSTEVRAAPLVFPNPQPSIIESRHTGGIALNDASQGLRVQPWTCRTDGSSVFISAPSVPEAVLFTGTEITEVSLAFDQNMRPFVAFVELGVAKYYWFDSQDATQKTSTLPAGSTWPRATLDDTRETQSAEGDILLAYIREGALYYRQQRDRYTIERLLSTDCTGLLNLGMSTNLRVRFEVLR